jgi:hypothetical protein
MMLIVVVFHMDQKHHHPYINGFEFVHAQAKSHVMLASEDVITYL